MSGNTLGQMVGDGNLLNERASNKRRFEISTVYAVNGSETIGSLK